MKISLPVLLVFLLQLFTITKSIAEITITHPQERTIYQRDNHNSAKIVIGGNFTDNIDRIEAQLRAINNTGFDSDWITIQQQPSGGYYQGTIEWFGGWYELEIRGWYQGNYVGSAHLSRVGIGEVFIIAGQSNAQGFYGYGAINPDDDRVNCVNEFNVSMNYNELAQPRFSKMETNSTIGPRGQSAWYWGQMGKLLCQRLNVPVLFYNAGWEGTSSINWKESTTGNTKSHYINAWYEDRMPYGNLLAIFNSYLSVTGARGVLWHQGEADARFNTSTANYVANLQAVINKSRQDAGHNLSWVIARASYDEFQGGVSKRIIDAQNRVINTVSNVFAGPNTDAIQLNRRDGVHFFDDGHYAVAQSWADALNDHFFSQSQPVSALEVPSVSVACAGNNQLRLTVHDEVRAVHWNNGSNDRSTTVGRGTYKAKIVTTSGKILYSPEIRVPDQVQPQTPNIRLEGSNPVCRGNEAILIADNVVEAYWNTGFVGNRMSVTTSGDYQVRIKNLYGCEANSNVIQVSVIDSPLPATPNIQVNGATTFCEGGQVALTSTSDVHSVWSTGNRDKTLDVRHSGIYTVRALDDKGCYSPHSSPVTVQVNANPAKPHVSLEGSAIFCEGGNVTLRSSYENSNTWNTGTNDRSISVSQSGLYAVTYRDHNGCEATSDQVAVQVNPLPAPPQITALRPTEFCDRDYTILQSNEQHSYQWNSGHRDREVTIGHSGEYFLTTIDLNGCQSLPSSPVRVQVNPLPATPTIVADKSTQLCENEFITLTASPEIKYIWNNGTDQATLRTNQQGDYYVRTINGYNCTSDPSNTISVSTLPIPAIPFVQALGETDFCNGETLTIQAQGSGSLHWSTGDVGEQIFVQQSGDYSVRSLAENGCYSYPTEAINVSVREVPTKPSIEQIGTFSLAGTTSVEGGTFSWYQDNRLIDDQTDAIIKAKQSGSYTTYQTIRYTDVLSCSSELSDPFLYRLENNNGLSVFPNPSYNGTYTIEVLEDFPSATISIFDTNGNLVTQRQHVNTRTRQTLDISGLKSGTYILKVQYLSESAVQKIVLAL